MKLRKLKKVISMFCATVMVMSCFVTSVAAESDTTIAEICFSLWQLSSLPLARTGGQGPKIEYDYLKKISPKRLNSNRECQRKYEDGKIDTVQIDEKAVYDEIRAKVKELEKKVDDRTPTKPLTEDERKNIEQGKKSKHYKLPKKMRLAKAIYRWVAKNIKYDYDSLKKDENGQESFRKPQDAIFVYSQRMGVCEGKSNLVDLMMRMANIPSLVITTIAGQDGKAHAYNAIYLEDYSADRKGWTLLDSTWAVVDSDNSVGENKNDINSSNNDISKEYFPAFYDNNITFLEANTRMVKLSHHKISYIFSGKISRDFDDEYVATDELNDGIIYKLYGREGDAYVSMFARNDDLIKSASICPRLLKLNIKFKVGKGIQSLTLRGNETIDLSDATDLEAINARMSKKYMAENGVLYEKNRYGTKGNKVDVPVNTRVLGEKAKFINEENQNILEKLKDEATSDFEWYKEHLQRIKYPDNLFQQTVKEYGDKYDEVISLYNALKDNPTGINVNIFRSKIYDFTHSICNDVGDLIGEYGCVIF